MTPERNRQKFAFDLPDELRDRADRHSTKMGVAMTTLAKIALDEYLRARGA
ncbi:MAG: hypothetical protein V1735_06355 [Nanoarchaeota archaeon]